MEKWFLRMKKTDFNGLSHKLGVDPVVVRLMCNRDVEPEDMDGYLHPSLSGMEDPHLLPDVDEAAGLLLQLAREGQAIRIIGDYDIDGVNASYILQEGLRKLGIEADTAIPNRMTDGYGLNRHLVDLALEDGKKVLLTCDNGIAAAEEIAYAKEKGMSVIVTDHHNVPYKEEGGEKEEILPQADYVVDPKRQGSRYPFPDICGAVVAMKFLQVLYEKAGRDKDEPYCFMENAAFATVGDVMPLKKENRVIVTYGLRQMNQTKNIGLKALIRANQIGDVKAFHLGFVLGPCINASGRLETAMESMSLLLEKDPVKAARRAEKLVELNAERKELTRKGVEQAVEQVETSGHKDDSVYFLYLPDCLDSIAGIVAGRIKEKYNRPTFVAAGTGEKVKGSARSIEAYSMYDEMTACGEYFVQFGGHPMAAGFTVEVEKIPALREALNKHASLTEDDLAVKKYMDMRMPLSYITEGLVGQLELLEPFGTDNEKPLFAENKAVFLSAARIGKEKNMARFSLLTETGGRMNGVYFGDADRFFAQFREKYGIGEEEALLEGRGSRCLSFCYYPQVNEYRGIRSLQVVISGFLF